MEIKAELVKQLRERTGVGLMDCKEALKLANGDIEKAIEYLREKGLAKIQRRMAKKAQDGIIAAYIHTGGKIGGMVEINCETDFVANTKEFQELARDIAMQVVATSPLYVKRDDVPKEVIEKEREIYKKQALDAGKPEKIAEKIAEGKLEKFFQEVCLLEQAYIKNPEITVKHLLDDLMMKTGEKIVINRFVRFQLGEKDEE
ncbi:MAG: translation elongation factor Ts [Desulfobacterota bacterium]|nr:translation elongation factor Ts [Thermodesulfobacteriota bacterium]MDW8001446.1 translation elongation factor Ts [Deltaproteobacteria bacterium]